MLKNAQQCSLNPLRIPVQSHRRLLATVPPHFYSNRTLEQYAARHTNRLSLRQLLFFGRSISEERLIKSANYVRTELPVRLAHRIRDLQSLPYVVVTEEHVSQVYNLYWTAFEKLRKYPEITTLPENDRFCNFMQDLLNEHSPVIPILSLGLTISSPYLPADDLDAFMRRMLVSRISRRVLTQHHISLTQGMSQKAQTGNHVGIIFTDLNVKRAIEKCMKLLLPKDSVSKLVLQSPELQELPKWPEITIDGDLNVSFPYIREHLEYIIFELLQNALRSTALRLHAKPDLVPGIIRATISSDEDEMYLRFSDQGGGLMLYDTQSPSDLYSFSHLRNSSRLDTERIGALRQGGSQGLFGIIDEQTARWGQTAVDGSSEESAGQQFERMGLGLPLSNIYATYFGGSLDLVSCDGWGTDVYLRLPRLGTNLEGIEL